MGANERESLALVVGLLAAGKAERQRPPPRYAHEP